MSHDVDLTEDDDPVYISVTFSAGVVRIHVSETGHHPRAMSGPVPLSALKELFEALRFHVGEKEDP